MEVLTSWVVVVVELLEQANGLVLHEPRGAWEAVVMLAVRQ